MEVGQYSFSAAHPTHGLAHLSYHCPGLHGAGACKQDIGKRSFGELLAPGQPRLRIPPFQRAYCWDQGLATGWWRDCQKGAHSTGKAIFSPMRGAVCRELLVIDGQQRLTTTCLLLAALRDAALRAGTGREAAIAARIAGRCDAALFTDRRAAYAWLKHAKCVLAAASDSWEAILPASGAAPPFLSLVPTVRDREAFVQLMIAGRLGLAPRAAECPMILVKAYFDNALTGRGISQLAVDLRCVLAGMSVMAVTLVQPPEGLPQQVYQWVQERALASSIEIHNPSPGVWLTVADLLRNLLLAPLLERQAEETEEILKRIWLPLEIRFDSPPEFDKFLQVFVDATPRAPVTASAKAMFDAADGTEGIIGRCELVDKLRLYGGIVAEYDVVAAAGHDKLMLIEALTAKLLRFALEGTKVPEPVQSSMSDDTPMMPPPQLQIRCPSHSHRPVVNP